MSRDIKKRLEALEQKFQEPSYHAAFAVVRQKGGLHEARVMVMDGNSKSNFFDVISQCETPAEAFQKVEQARERYPPKDGFTVISLYRKGAKNA